jgi:hypothetical protein
MKTWTWRSVIWLTWFTFLGLAGCGVRAGTTQGIDATQAHQTVQAMLTQTMAASTLEAGQLEPTLKTTFTASPPAAATLPSQGTFTPLPSVTPRSPSPTAVCDRAAAGSPIDLTIPDNTVFVAGTPFTKIWRLVNAGTCTWNRSYAARFFYGSLMQAPEVVYLSQDVPPGQMVEIAVDMVAPATPGVQQGNWKLQNANGELFGIGPNGDAPFWVRIVVELPATPTPTLTPTATVVPSATPTATPTPPATAQGSLSLQIGQAVDLDTGTLDSGDADDVRYQLEVGGFHFLSPQTGTVMGVFGLAMPGIEACRSAGMSAAPLALESLTVGSYLCYQTDQGLVGWLRYNSLDVVQQLATLDFYTWASP